MEEIRSRLAIDKSRLDDELEIHSQIADQLATRVAKLEREVAEAADAVKRCEAGLVLDMRREDKPPPVVEQEARIVRDNSRREAHRTLLAYTEQLATWKGLQDAWKTKHFGIRALVDLHAAAYFNSASTVASRRDREEHNTDYRNELRRSVSDDAAPRRRRIAE